MQKPHFWAHLLHAGCVWAWLLRVDKILAEAGGIEPQPSYIRSHRLDQQPLILRPCGSPAASSPSPSLCLLRLLLPLLLLLLLLHPLCTGQQLQPRGHLLYAGGVGSWLLRVKYALADTECVASQLSSRHRPDQQPLVLRPRCSLAASSPSPPLCRRLPLSLLLLLLLWRQLCTGQQPHPWAYLLHAGA
jgi:hypothetical protein